MDPNEKKILIFTSAAHYLTHLFVTSSCSCFRPS
jgi:hypothetical protein